MPTVTVKFSQQNENFTKTLGYNTVNIFMQLNNGFSQTSVKLLLSEFEMYGKTLGQTFHNYPSSPAINCITPIYQSPATDRTFDTK
jgi:hypothetical protein